MSPEPVRSTAAGRASTAVARPSVAVTERLAPEHQAWLEEFSVVMHRRYAYPPKHPSRVAAEQAALAAVSRALEQHAEIIVGVTRRQLAIDGGFSDPKNPATSELAERLHRQGIGTITMRAGLTAAEFEELLTAIVESAPASEDDALDAVPDPSAHIAIERLTYEGLALSEEADEDGLGNDATGDRLWRELAEMALVGWDGSDGLDGAGGGDGPADGATGGSPGGTAASPDAAAPRRRTVSQFALTETGEFVNATSADRLAQMISQRASDPRFAADMLKSMLRVGRHARRRGRNGSGAVAARLRDVLQRVQPGTLKALLESEVDPARQRVLFLQGVDALPVSAVLDWVEAAAQSSNQSISHHLLRLLKKLSSQARRRRDNGPDEGGEALREAARSLIEDWHFEGRNNEAHSSLLETLASYDAVDRPLDGGEAAGAVRIAQIALETDAVGHDVLAAIDQLIDTKRLTALFGLLDRIPASATTAPAIRAHLVAPDALRRSLLTEPVDAEGTRLLLALCEPPQAESLLDALAIAEMQETRMLILLRLREMGPAIGDAIIARLEGSAWELQRNLLSLLVTMPTLPANLRVEPFAKHEQPTVRVEAVRVLSRMPAQREAAIHDALLDPDARVVRAAFDGAQAGGVPRRSALRLLQCLQKTESGSDLRVRGIPLLGQAPTTAARDWLLTLALRRRGLFRRLALKERSPELLAVLRVLAAHWARDGALVPAFRLAAKSSDAEIRETVRTVGAK